MPPVDVLKKSLSYVAQGRVDEGVRAMGLSSSDKIRRYAQLARRLSSKVCFFCEAPRAKTKVKANTWEGYELCGCLDHMKKGYREHNPWENRLAQIPSLIESGSLDPNMIAYSNECIVDGTRFNISFGQIARAYKKYNGNYLRAKRCLACMVAKKKKDNQAKPPRVNQLVPATEASLTPVVQDLSPRARTEGEQKPFIAAQRMGQRRGAAPKKRWVNPGKPRGFAQPLSAPIAEQLAAKHPPTEKDVATG
jgi:hypothetical protein